MHQVGRNCNFCEIFSSLALKEEAVGTNFIVRRRRRHATVGILVFALKTEVSEENKISKFRGEHPKLPLNFCDG
jgi:hypothetical protein